MIGEILALLTATAWAIAAICDKQAIKLGADPLGAGIIRLFVAFAFLIISISIVGKFNVIYTAKPAMLYLILGGLLGGTIGVVGFYAALKFISVSKAVPIISTFPLLAALFAVISLGEKLTPQLLVGTALVVAGITLVGYS